MAVVTARVNKNRLDTRLFREVRMQRRQRPANALNVEGRVVERIRRFVMQEIPYYPNPMDAVD